MGATFVITLREGFEAALLLGIVCAYLAQIGRRDLYYYVGVGAGLGAAASVALGAGLSLFSGPLLDLGPDLVSAAVLFVAVLVLTWHGWWMRQHARAIRGHVHRRLDDARASRRLWLVGVIAFAGVFREGAETVLFLGGLLSQATSASGGGALLGGVAGVGAAGVLGWIVFRGGQRVSLRAFFGATSVVILFLAAGMLGTGLGKLQALGVLPQTGALWDTSAWLAEEGPVGGFLQGLVGYRARPSAFEAAGYFGYLLVAGALLFWSPARRAATCADAAVEGAAERFPVDPVVARPGGSVRPVYRVASTKSRRKGNSVRPSGRRG